MIREAAQKRRFLESGKWLTGEAYEEGVNELFTPSGTLVFTLVNYRSAQTFFRFFRFGAILPMSQSKIMP